MKYSRILQYFIFIFRDSNPFVRYLLLHDQVKTWEEFGFFVGISLSNDVEKPYGDTFFTKFIFCTLSRGISWFTQWPWWIRDEMRFNEVWLFPDSDQTFIWSST